MMRRRRASVIAALSLLAWAATASAECAWVLWQHTALGGRRQVTTEPVDGHPTRQACGEAIKAALAAAESSRTDTTLVTVDRNANSVSTLIKTKAGKIEPFSTFSLVCLPDTVDPRGPKGK